MGGRAPLRVHELGGKSVVERGATQPLEHLRGVGAEQPSDLHHKAVRSTDPLGGATVRGVGAVHRFPERQPERRTDRVVVQRPLASQIDRGGECPLRLATRCEVATQRGPYRRGVLHLLGRLVVERLLERVECERHHGVPVQRVGQRDRASVKRDLGAIERMLTVASRREVVVRNVERVGEHRLLDDLVVAGLADVALGRDRVTRRALEREARLE